MFYNVAKASREKERRDEQNSRAASEDGKERGRGRSRRGTPADSRQSSSEMDPGLWGRNIHANARSRSRSPQPPSSPRSRVPSRAPSLHRNQPGVATAGSGGVADNMDTHSHASLGKEVVEYGNDGYSDEYSEYDDYGSDEEENFQYVPKCMMGVPLKDFDSGQENTFVIVQNKVGKQAVFRFNKEPSLWLFGPTSIVRRISVYIVTHQWFEMIILLTIVTNCVFMAISDAPKEAEYIFAVIYTFEMSVKILARGFILHNFSYLRNSWNWLDFLVVMLGYVTMHPAVEKFSAVKTFRVLRALKTISTVKGLKAMVNTLIKSMKMMTDVLILTLFFIAIFALIGLQLFLGKLRSRCVKFPANINHTVENEIIFDPLYNQKLNGENKLENILYFNGEEIICGNNSFAWKCPLNFEEGDFVDDHFIESRCLPFVGKNPINDGYISYDNFGSAMLTSLQVCTLDYWESVYNAILSACGEPYMIYFLFAVFLGPFYLLNLVLAVVSASYEMEVNGNPDQEAEKENQARFRRTASVYSFNGDAMVEYLHGDSPIEEIDGKKEYTVPIDAPEKKEKKEAEPFVPPVLGDNPGMSTKIHVFCYKVVSSNQFEGLIIVCIMLTTVLMGTEHFEQPDLLTKIQDIGNHFFSATFLLEMIFKLIAYTPRVYARNPWNLFDGFLVIVSIIDVLLTVTNAIEGGSLKVLRVFRLMRVLKLAQSWKTMGQLLSTIAQSMGALGNITVILGIIIYIFAVVGMQLFGSDYDPKLFDPNNEQKGNPWPRYNFYNFGNSFMMVFRILCGKWIEPQWDLLKRSSEASILFIFLVFVIGRWVVLNLFLALLLSSFGGDALSGDDEDDEDKEKDEDEKPKKTRMQRLIEWTKKRKNRKQAEALAKERGYTEEDNNGIGNPEMQMHVEIYNNNSNLIIEENGKNNILENGNGHKHPLHESNGTIICKESQMNSINSPIDPNSLPNQNGKKYKLNGSGSFEGDIEMHQTQINDTSSFNGISKRGNSSSSVKIEIHREKTYVDDCLCSFCYQCSCCFTSYLESPFRRMWHNSRYHAKMFIENKYFEGLILFLIAFSSMTLVFEDVYLEEKKTMSAFLGYCNYFFAIIFAIEFLLKLFAMGFVKYFTNAWNLLDVFIVAISLASLFGNSDLKALRSLRGLRPLRAVSRFEGMKIVVNALLYSIPSIANVCLVCLIFWLIFSIMGYTFFGGCFHRCKNNDGDDVLWWTANNRTECIDKNFTWTKRNVNFDSSIDGFLALFQTATLEGWFEAMADAQDLRGINMTPGFQETWYTQLYFVIFIVLGAFFVLNLFIGVIIDNFNRLKQQYEDGVGIFLTPSQRNWINTLKAAALQRPSRRLTRPTSKWRSTLFDFIHTKDFEFFIMSVILLNMITMMIQHYGQTEEVELALEYLNYLFTGIFTIEAVIRLIAMRLEYFRYGMNVFDFIIVVFSIAVIALEKMGITMPISPGLFRVVRVFRLTRLLRFFEAAKGIRKLLFTIVKSAPALLNIGLLLFLIMFIFAIMGMSLFGNVKLTGSLNPRINFKTFFSSLCLLFRISTAAGWNGVLDACMVKEPICNATYHGITGVTKGNCGHTLIAPLFFVIYVLLVVLIIINMYIAVILENFNQAQSQDEVGIAEDDLESFYQTWEEFDPKATQFIDYSELSDFIDRLEGPLRVKKPNYWWLAITDIPIKDQNRCHCLDIMTALISNTMSENGMDERLKDDEMFSKVMVKVEAKYNSVFPQRAKEPTKETTRERMRKEVTAVQRIQRVYRKHLLMYEINQLSQHKVFASRFRPRSDKNLEKIEQLVTVLWKTIKNRQEELQAINEREENLDEDTESFNREI